MLRKTLKNTTQLKTKTTLKHKTTLKNNIKFKCCIGNGGKYYKHTNENKFIEISKSQYLQQLKLKGQKIADVHKLIKSVYPTQFNDYILLQRSSLYVPVNYQLANLIKFFWKQKINVNNWRESMFGDQNMSIEFSRYSIDNKKVFDMFIDMFGKKYMKDITPFYDDVPRGKLTLQKTQELKDKFPNNILYRDAKYCCTIVFNQKILEYVHNKLNITIPKKEDAFKGNQIISDFMMERFQKYNKIIPLITTNSNNNINIKNKCYLGLDGKYYQLVNNLYYEINKNQYLQYLKNNGQHMSDINKLKKSIYPSKFNDYILLKLPIQYFPADYKLANLISYFWKNNIDAKGWNQNDKLNGNGFISFSRYTIKNQKSLDVLSDMFGKTYVKNITPLINDTLEFKMKDKQIDELQEKYSNKIIYKDDSNFSSIIFNQKMLEYMHKKLNIIIPKEEDSLQGMSICPDWAF
jgi:hypothetical protein